MHIQSIIRQCAWLLLLPLLAGCGAATTTATLPAQTQTATLVSVQVTQTATISPTPLQTETPAPTATNTPGPFLALDGLRVAYVMDGNIYVQDSGKSPVQLTQRGQDFSPMLSSDGEKIVFFRGSMGEQYQLYVINADGSHEQALVTGSIMAKLGLGYDETTEINSYHLMRSAKQLLFNTQQFKPNSTGSYNPSTTRNKDLLVLDIETLQIKRLQKPGDVPFFRVSPDEKLITDSKNILRANGDVVRRNFIADRPEWEHEYTDLSWSQDSNKLIYLGPIKGDADGTSGPEPNTIFKYSLNGNAPVEIRLNPPPIAQYETISLDGNWIAYCYVDYQEIMDPTIPAGVYIGNLRDGSSHLVESGEVFVSPPDSFTWSPDSSYFIFESAATGKPALYLSNTQGNITLLPAGRFIGWIDNNRYLYKKDDILMSEVGKQEDMSVMKLPARIEYLTYIFVNPDTKK